MTYQFRIPCDPEYISALGRAAYNFSYLEWMVIYLIDALEPGYIDSDHHRKSAGNIAADLKTAVPKATGLLPELSERLAKLADRFEALVVRRNDLLHAHPYTEINGAQRLIRRRKNDRSVLKWPTQEILNAAKSFEEAAIDGIDLFHNHLNASRT